MSLLTTLVAGGAVAVLAAGAAGVVSVVGASASTSAASAPTSTPVSTPIATRGAEPLERACARIPLALARAQKVRQRSAADAQTPGSIAYLQARIAKATAAGNTDLARVLTDRLTMRQDVAGILPDRVRQLSDAQQVCATTGATRDEASPRVSG